MIRTGGAMARAEARKALFEAQRMDSRVKTAALQQKERSDYLEDRIDKLSLICQAMWALLEEHTTFTEAHLLAKVQELDMEDGVLDGKRAPQAKNCPSCQRTFAAKHPRCLYCGTEVGSTSVFDP
jgi:ribosomal protein S27AE